MFKQAAAIGADIGNFSLKIAVVNFGREVLSVKSYPLKHVQTKDYLLSKIVSAVRDIRATVALDGINPLSIGISVKGFIDHQSGVIFVGLRSTGIGGWIIINGKLYRGVNNAGGEIGQMIINYDNGLSDKGIRGSFEHFASAFALVRRYSELSGIMNSKSRKTLTGKEIFELSYKKDPAAIKAVKENAEMVGVGLANLITIFAPYSLLRLAGKSI
ncbi:MAG: ROK family protein [Bacteroidales bacterium]|jgi:glucokinase|nr:ROK family protein [Bacteroidales bacterium]